MNDPANRRSRIRSCIAAAVLVLPTMLLPGVASAAEAVIAVDQVRLLPDRSATVIVLTIACPDGPVGDALAVELHQRDSFAATSINHGVECGAVPTTYAVRTTHATGDPIRPGRAFLRATVGSSSCPREGPCPEPDWQLETRVVVRPK